MVVQLISNQLVLFEGTSLCCGVDYMFSTIGYLYWVGYV